MSYLKPQVLVFQEFQLASNEITDALRAWIVGPNVKLHRYSESDEKALIGVGPYDRSNDTEYPWPDKTAGSLVDSDSVKIFIEDALLMYFADEIGVATGGYGKALPVSGHKNYVRHDTVNFVSNGASYPRSSLLNDRDVQVGDIVTLKSIYDPDDNCEEVEFCSVVEGFAADTLSPSIGLPVLDENNQHTTTASATISQTAGNTNCISATTNGSAYDGRESGYITEGYTITVIKSSVTGCNAARLRITSDSGTDDVEEINPEDFGSPTDIGTRGLTVTFSKNATCSSESLASYGSSEAFPADFQEFEVGQVWYVQVTQAFEQVCAEQGATYTGPDDDTYIVEVTKGGAWADNPQIVVTTTKGLDSSGPTTVSGANVAVPIGNYGLTITFRDCGSFEGGSEQFSSEFLPGMGDNALAGLCTGDKFYITVVSGANGPIHTLILRDDLPTKMLSATDMELRLYIVQTIEVTENRLSSPPLKNYVIEDDQVVLKAGITAYSSSWTKNGVEQAMPVWDDCLTLYGRGFCKVYIQYNEYLTALVDQINFIDDVADLDDIPGQLDEENILKWGVYRALQNAGGTRVAYTAVSDPSDLEAWQTALERANGRDDIYNYVPLTYDREVHNLFQAQVEAESSPERGNWKGMIVNLQAKTSRMVVGKSSADAQALNPTSLDGAVVLATLEDNPNASGTQYTLLSVPGNNAGFITHKVKAGDIVRFLYTIDAFGASTYKEFIVDRVLSEESLLLLQGHTTSISVAQKMEIWHVLNKNEIAADLVDQAQSYASSRVVATWPDIVGTAGNAQSGYFLAAAIGGLISGVVPHQGLTNVEVAGFDDLASRTKDFFSGSQLDTLAAGGIWIVTEDADGTPHTRHALTTATIDLNRSEEMIRRNYDSMSYVFHKRLRKYIGRANVTQSMLEKSRYEINQTIRFFKGNGYTPELGPQLIDGSIALDAQGAEILRVHPLAADRIEAVVTLDGPEPLNNYELHLMI